MRQRCRIEARAVRRVLGKNAFGFAPGPRRRDVHVGIGIEDAAEIGLDRLRAFVFGQGADEVAVKAGIEPRQHVEKTVFDFLDRAEESGAQHDAGDAVGMGLRIGQRQCRAPGAANDHPAVEAELSRGSLPCPRSDAAGCWLRGGPLGGCGRRRAGRTAPRESVRGRTAGDDPAGSRCRARHADRPRACRRRGRRFRHRCRGRRRRRVVPMSAAQTDRRV